VKSPCLMVQLVSSNRSQVEFLHLEYSVHQRLFEASTCLALPVVAIADGIVMGAGAGLWMASNVRIATNKALFAMPEANIGLCPDAGALHFLRTPCPPSVGLYLALTGARLGPTDLLYTGLATHQIDDVAGPSSKGGTDEAGGTAGCAGGLAATLAACAPIEAEAVLARFGAKTATEAAAARVRSEAGEDAVGAGGELEPVRGAIDAAFALDGDGAKGSVAEVVSSLEALISQHTAAASSEPSRRVKAWASSALGALVDSTGLAVGTGADAGAKRVGGCPTSLEAAFRGMRLLQRGLGARLAALDEAKAAEAARAVELLINGWMASRPDFAEGVACAVGAKRGQPPVWSPSPAAPKQGGEGGAAAVEGGASCGGELAWDLGLVESEAARLASAGDLTLRGAREALIARMKRPLPGN